MQWSTVNQQNVSHTDFDIEPHFILNTKIFKNVHLCLFGQEGEGRGGEKGGGWSFGKRKKESEITKEKDF